MRAMPSAEAMPSSTSAWANDPVWRARPRAAAGFSPRGGSGARDELGGREQVGDELGELDDAVPGSERCAKPAAHWCGGIQLGRLVVVAHVDPSNEVSARAPGAISAPATLVVEIHVQERV